MVVRIVAYALLFCIVCCVGCKPTASKQIQKIVTNKTECVDGVSLNIAYNHQPINIDPDEMKEIIQKFPAKIAYWLGPAKTTDRDWWMKD